jgi:tetratricopeptide (TPR) repeat protein
MMKRLVAFVVGLLGLLILVNQVSAQSMEMQSAKLYKKQGEIDKAIEWLEKAIAKKPENAEAHYLLGELYGQKGRMTDMVKEFDASLSHSKKYEKDIEPLRQNYFAESFNAGVKAANASDYPEALKGFLNAKSIDSKDIRTYKNLAFVYLRMDSISAALGVYQALLAIQPSDYDTYITMAQIYNDEKRKEYDKSVEILQKGQAAAPDSVRPRLVRELGITYDMMGKGDEAVKMYQEALQARPDDGSLLFNLGYLYYRRADYPNAILGFKKVLDIDAEDFEANYHLGRSYLLVGEQQDKQGRELEEAAMKKKKMHTKQIDSLKAVAKENFKAARPYLEKAVTLKPEDHFAWHDLAVSCIRTGDNARGEEALKKEEELRANSEKN